MERRALGVVAIVLIGLMALVATAGLDNLPPALHKSVDAAAAVLSTDRHTFEQDRSAVEQALSQDPDFFAKEADSWRARLDQDRGKFEAAAAKLAALQQLEKANRRTDDYNVERGLNEFNSLREDARRDSSGIRSEIERREAARRSLPERIQAMQASYQAVQAIEGGDATAPARKAIVDWPAKREDLQNRLDRLREVEERGQKLWESSAELRAAAASTRVSDADMETLLSEADDLDRLGQEAKSDVSAIDALAGQLYVSWDKLLLEVERAPDAQEKVRIVRTRYPDASLTNGDTTSEERWEPLEQASLRDARDSAGMVIEHKPAGKYDSEAEQAVQPPAYAYIAPPGQANHYGSWSDGVWHWLPQYLILSQLLHASRGTITAPDYDSYENARRRGESYYGRNRGFTWPRSYGGEEGGGFYHERPRSAPPPSTARPVEPRPSNPPSFGGFSGSRYQNRGSFSTSPYRSRGTYGSGGFGGAGRSYSRSRGGRR